MGLGCVVWLTGFSGCGKTTIARLLETELRKRGEKVEVLDGDEVRQGLSPKLGFSAEDRNLHNRRVIYLSKLLMRNGVNVIVSLISPYRKTRAYARAQLARFIEVYVKASIEECIRRDPKGLYKRALAGEIKQFTGIDDPYEEPINPEVLVNTEQETPQESTQKILDYMRRQGYI
jgi:adenylyl-sulfate kinase